MSAQERTHLDFENTTRKYFSFLKDLGFSEIESLPTMIRYQKGILEVNVYHGRQSYEIGFGISYIGTHYSMADIIRTTDPSYAKQYRNVVARTREKIAEELEGLASLVKRYADAVLREDQKFLVALENQQKLWAEEYALDVLVDQLRPKAAEAFRQANYSTAAELYERIRSRLSPAEIKKLIFAEAEKNKRETPEGDK